MGLPDHQFFEHSLLPKPLLAVVRPSAYVPAAAVEGIKLAQLEHWNLRPRVEQE